MCSVDKTGCEAIITQRALVFLSAVASRFRSCGGSAENFVVMLLNDAYYPYRKPNNETVYINTKSNHPPSILKSLPAAINRRISDISCNEEVFNRNKQHYEDALKRSGHNVTLRYADNSDHANSSTQRTHRSKKETSSGSTLRLVRTSRQTSEKYFWA